MIALLTDFGVSDIYVGVMKSVILGLAPDATLIDLTHDVPPQNIAVGALQIAAAWSYLPDKTILLCVVDPGVGGSRRAIASDFGRTTFVGPDNGLLSRVLEQAQPQQTVEMTNTRYQLPSRRGETFHGRDVFAPAAAHLSLGIALSQLGGEINASTLVRLRQSESSMSRDGIHCAAPVALIDHFGNIVLDLSAASFTAWAGPRERFTARCLARNWSASAIRAENYTPRADTELLLVANSYGLMEIARPAGSAADLLPVGLGEAIELSLN